jgi:hypothetical protein
MKDRKWILKVRSGYSGIFDVHFVLKALDGSMREWIAGSHGDSTVRIE